MANDTLDQLDKLQRDMHQALGAALDSWGNVEANLCSIYCAAMSPTSYNVASAAFSAIISFEVQIAIAAAAVKEKFSTDSAVLDGWKAAYKELEKQRPIRNKLAHGKMIIVLNKSRPDPKHEPRFLPFFHYHTHKDRKEFIHLNTPDIKAIQKDFQNLTKTLSAFGKTIGAKQTINVDNWVV